MARVKGQGGCLSEYSVIRLVSGGLESAERGPLDGHLVHCDRCARLVGEVARDTGSVSAGFADRLRPPVLSPGMTIANRYHVRRLLGVGAMGEVHEVDDNLLGTVVALKTLNARLAGDSNALARLKREVAAARSVTHPNVCRIFDLGSDAGNDKMAAFAFLTMELLSGVTLTRYLAAHGPLAPRDALPLLLQLADGLAAAHVAGIVHRDLKSENIMLVEPKRGGLRAVIMDFGLAGFDMPDESGVEHGSGFSGTVAYAAPERIAGGRATAASDVYSLGLIAHEMLTGKRPLPGVAAARIAGGGPLPAAWEKLIRRAIHHDPKVRFANGDALAAGLRALDVRARQGSAWARRRVALGAVAFAAALAVFTSWASRGRQEPPLPAVQEAQSVAMPPPRPAPATTRAPRVLSRSHAPVVVEQVGGTMPDPVPERRRRTPAKPLPASVGALTAMATPAPNAAPAAAAAPQLHPSDDDLVREVRFRPVAPRAAGGNMASEAELVDPFARRRPSRTADAAP
jgi:hypothetical protein